MTRQGSSRGTFALYQHLVNDLLRPEYVLARDRVFKTGCAQRILDLQAGVRDAIDPNGIANPGKILPDGRAKRIRLRA